MYEGNLFAWKKDFGGSVDASTLGWKPGVVLPSFQIRSHRTGRVLNFSRIVTNGLSTVEEGNTWGCWVYANRETETFVRVHND